MQAGVSDRTAKDDAARSPGRRVLNVGGGSKRIPIPAHFSAWEHVLLDIDPTGDADVVCDARELTTLAAAQFDAVYCSHNLEHYYRHDAARVLQGFLHVLKADGFAHIRVPDIKAVMQRVVGTGMDVEDVLYDSPDGPIRVSDVLYGYGKQIEQTGNDFYAHKNGFTANSLTAAMKTAGFPIVYISERPDLYEVIALAFRAPPSEANRALLGL